MDIQLQRKNASLVSKGTSSNEIVNAIISQIEQISTPFTNILDIGCGTGDLLLKVKAKFPKLELHGADYTDFSGLSNFDINFRQVDCNNDFSSNFQTYDVITCSEVIEHLENGRHFLRQLSKLLNPNGTLILTTPNTESLTSILSFIFKGYHSAFGPKEYPAHINSFSEYEMKNMIREISEIDFFEIHYIPNGRVPGTPLKWHSFTPIRSKRFSDNFLVVVKKSLL